MRKAHHREVKDYGRSQVRNLGKEDMVTHYRKPSIDNQVYLTLFCFNSFLFLLFSLFSAGGGLLFPVFWHWGGIMLFNHCQYHINTKWILWTQLIWMYIASALIGLPSHGFIFRDQLGGLIRIKPNYTLYFHSLNYYWITSISWIYWQQWIIIQKENFLE